MSSLRCANTSLICDNGKFQRRSKLFDVVRVRHGILPTRHWKHRDIDYLFLYWGFLCIARLQHVVELMVNVWLWSRVCSHAWIVKTSTAIGACANDRPIPPNPSTRTSRQRRQNVSYIRRFGTHFGRFQCTDLIPSLRPFVSALTVCHLTVSALTTENGKECAIPYVYRGKIKYGCIEAYSEGKPWCSLTANYDVDKKYGYCNSQCLFLKF